MDKDGTQHIAWRVGTVPPYWKGIVDALRLADDGDARPLWHLTRELATKLEALAGALPCACECDLCVIQVERCLEEARTVVAKARGAA